MAHKVANDILIPEIARLVAGGQEVVFTPTGVSMRPYIEGGVDSVILTRAQEVRVGDIVLAQYGSIYVLHRVIAMEQDHLTLMGDGNLQGTECVLRSNVLAKVTAIRSRRGHNKPLTNGWLWRKLLPIRWLLLKIYRKTYLKVIR